MRILITGSRDWDEEWLIGSTIVSYLRGQERWDEYQESPIGRVTIVHGACPTGADKMADAFGFANGFSIESHPADWDKFGKRAGFLRNSEMVNLGADVCIAFIKDNSKGATMTADLAQKAKIPTVIIRKTGKNEAHRNVGSNG